MRRHWRSISTRIWPSKLRSIVTETEKEHLLFISSCFWQFINHFRTHLTVRMCYGKRTLSSFCKSIQVNLNLIQLLCLRWFLIPGCWLNMMGEFTSFWSLPSSIHFIRGEQLTHQSIFLRWICWMWSITWFRQRGLTWDLHLRRNVVSVILRYRIR